MSENNNELKYTLRVPVRFSEVDAIRTVWHGNYAKYLEDAREAFGHAYGLSYACIFRNGYYAPMYDMQLHYRTVATIDDVLLVTAIYRSVPGSKIVFDYEIRRESDNALILTATTVQLFTTHEGEFCPVCPPFYAEWKEMRGLKLQGNKH
ncbi:MAG: acyl-CoA thioesterase [Paludibacter sp.]|nr:acyl-CoA thioesterase [Bacteroidales bacterium]MCM1068948.1 acyl-CoA thioesterase [Prevotella sp.]MCM1353611.1 acyl-CoA thioesterase [Bacteroides sp.]MCM1442040.1 acyl-CoA thioesterase [Muribaculum sp.]MCM1481504.1 acyl-CoA thioesterase [Paludibacter sp.]